MNKVMLKHISICSLIAGLIFGVFAAIPFIGGLALFAVLFLSAPFVMLFLIMAGKCDITTGKDSIINGAISGFFANITFAFAYCIIVALLYVVFKFTTNYFLTAAIINSPIWFLIVLIPFVGVLTATTNAFSGFLTYYIINLIRDIYERKHSSEDI
ncbi:hypothetical protein J6N69_04465 [bacterium]|nr:hypothetical protein [bacterium]